MNTSFQRFPQVAHWADLDRNALTKLADTMVKTSCRFSFPDGTSLANRSLAIGLVGTLGAGKTTFCQKLAAAFRMPPTNVTSPTFTLVRSYSIAAGDPGLPHRWNHLDLYRVADEDELWELGIEELWDEPGTWTVMEWADRFFDAMPPQTVWIQIDLAGEESPNRRGISVYCGDGTLSGWWADISERMKS